VGFAAEAIPEEVVSTPKLNPSGKALKL